MSFTSSVPTFAVEQYNQRVAYAARLHRSGEWTAQQADDKLKPWLAMAVLVGADLDDLNLSSMVRNDLYDAIAERRVKQTDSDDGTTEGQARWHVADSIAPRRVWVPELSTAHNAARDALRMSNEASWHLASGFIGMVALIGTDPDGRYSVPLYAAPEPMQQAA